LKERSPSDATINEAFRKAETLLLTSGIEDFENAPKSKVCCAGGEECSCGDRRIGTLGEARRLYNGCSVMHQKENISGI
jgi:hypothetical protein